MWKSNRHIVLWSYTTKMFISQCMGLLEPETETSYCVFFISSVKTIKSKRRHLIWQVNRIGESSTVGPHHCCSESSERWECLLLHLSGSKERFRNTRLAYFAYVMLQPTRLMLQFFIDLEQAGLPMNCFHVLSIN